MKLVLKLVAVLVVLALVAVAGVLFAIDAIAKTAVERGSTYALGVETTLADADVGILKGEFAMSGLEVANPEGFDRERFLRLDTGKVAVSLGSLRQDTVEVPLLALADIDVNLEKKGKESNYGVILGNLKKLESTDPKEQEEETSGKKFVIREVVITNVNVEADLFGVGGELNRVKIPIKEIRLTNVGSGTEKGVLMSELTNVILKSIMTAIVANAADLPGELRNDLGPALDQLDSLDEMGIDMSADVGKAVSDLLGEGSGDTGKQIGDAIEKGLGDLLRTKKEN